MINLVNQKESTPYIFRGHLFFCLEIYFDLTISFKSIE